MPRGSTNGSIRFCQESKKNAWLVRHVRDLPARPNDGRWRAVLSKSRSGRRVIRYRSSAQADPWPRNRAWPDGSRLQAPAALHLSRPRGVWLRRDPAPDAGCASARSGTLRRSRRSDFRRGGIRLQPFFDRCALAMSAFHVHVRRTPAGPSVDCQLRSQAEQCRISGRD